MKKFKRIMAALAAGVMAVTGMVINASASTSYHLHFTSGAPSYLSHLYEHTTVVASGGNRITVSSTQFTYLVSGAYMNADAVNFATNDANVNSVSNYYLYYQGQTQPKANIIVYVDLELMEYSTSGYVSAKGTLYG